jgi:hypothetical protein
VRHLLEKLGCCSQRGGDGCGGGGAGWWSLVNRDGKAGGQLAFTGGQSACPLLPVGRRRTSRRPLASVLLDMSAIRIKYTLRLAPTSPLRLLDRPPRTF